MASAALRPLLERAMSVTQRPLVFVEAEGFGKLNVPWPRRQDLSHAPLISAPTSDDIIVAVSHSWPCSEHPDPLGCKADHLVALLREAKQMHAPVGRTLVFFDWLSVTQRERTMTEQAGFEAALSAMPQLYVRSDCVVHLDFEMPELPGGTDQLTLRLEHLEGVSLLQLKDGRVQTVSRVNGEYGHWFVEAIDGAEVKGRSQVADALSMLPPSTPVTLRRSHLGLYNDVPASERGWIFLERFCSMVKCALVDPSEVHRVVLSTSASVLEEIRAGGERLRAAAQRGRRELDVLMAELIAELRTKHFGGASADKIDDADAVSASIGGGALRMHGGAARRGVSGVDTRLHAGADQAVASDRSAGGGGGGGGGGGDGGGEGDGDGGGDGVACQLSGDAVVVASLMQLFARQLAERWDEREREQRQRQLLLAINRCDVHAVTTLITSGADVTSMFDKNWGCSYLHIAAVQRDVRVIRELLRAQADPAYADQAGNTAAHKVSLYSEAQTLEVWKLLCPTVAVLTQRNVTGATPIALFAFWAFNTSSGSEGDGSRFAPAIALVHELTRQYPSLHQHINDLPTAGTPLDPHELLPPSARQSATRTSLNQRVHGWEHAALVDVWVPTGVEVEVELLFVHAVSAASLMEDAIDAIAQRLCAKHKARLTYVSMSRARVPLAPSFEATMARLHALVDSLHLQLPLVLVEQCSFVSGLAWRLSPLLAGLMHINVSGLHHQCFVGSTGFARVVLQSQQIAAVARARDPKRYTHLFGNIPYSDQMLRAAMDADGGYAWELMESYSNWVVKNEPAEFLLAQGSLSAAVEARILVGELSAAGAYSAAQLLHACVPNSSIRGIPKSVKYWFAEGALQFDAVVEEMDQVMQAARGQAAAGTAGV